MFNTENEVKVILRELIQDLHPNADIRVLKSAQPQNSLTRDVTFFIIIPISVSRDDVIFKINQYSILNEVDFYFSGSEAGMLHGDIDNDFIFVTAEVETNLNKG